jgi:hypothetical protein
MDATEENSDELYPEETVLDEVDAVIELFDLRPKRLREELRRHLVRIVEEDEDDAALAEAMRAIYQKLPERNQVRLIDLCCGYWPAGPLVCGALLHEILGDRDKIDRLFRHVGDDILRWFRRVPLNSLMSPEERRTLGALPSGLEAFHVTNEPGARVTLGPYWTLPAAGNDPAPAPEGGRLVRARVPRGSVLVYHRGEEEPVLIVDFRRVDAIEVVAGGAR